MLWLATLGPIGRLPMSGTCASLVALGSFIPIWLLHNWHTQALAVAIVSVSGIGICAIGSKRLRKKDPSEVVWDELAGMWLALIGAPFNLWYWLFAFAIFRLLDITKPSLIGWCDRRLKGGVGIMADDLVAGAFTLACMQTGWWLYGLA